MLSTIALVGRPNVGKSTLFNRLTNSRNALVSDSPGLTRDRQYGVAKIGDRSIIVIDTGGIGSAASAIEKLMAKQTELAMQEAEVILFLVDGKAGLIGDDQDLARKLRKLNKQVILVVNKIDGKDLTSVMADFYKLGFLDVIGVSAEHNLGFDLLSEKIIGKLPVINSDETLENQNAIKITFVGRPNVGKSTLINRILNEERLVAHNQPGTTRDSIFINFSQRGKDYILIDTAGVRRRSKVQEKIEKFSIVKTLQAVSASNVIVFLVDASETITDQDLKLIGFVLSEGKALVIAVNKWDNLSVLQRGKIKSDLERKLSFLNFVDIHFISALHGSGVGNLFKSINRAYKSATRELVTSELNKILEQAVQNHQPPLVHGREIKLRYAHAGHSSPPTIIVHGTRVEFLPDSYRRYLEGVFRKMLRLTGTPVQIIFKPKV